jgi:hemolysin activation/secretion protein
LTSRRSEAHRQCVTSQRIPGSQLRLALAAIALTLPIAGLAQQAPDSPVQVRKLALTATDQPQLDLGPIAASLEGHAYAPGDLQDRIQEKLRDDGYYFAHAETPQLANAQNGAADVSVQIQAGDRYTTGEITFKKAMQFPKEQMRSLFPLVAGKVFNAGAVQVGIDKLKSLYEAQGFADVGAVPSVAVDEAKKVIDVSVEVEEGYPYLFGQLTIDGAEPTPGAGKTLLTAWSQLAGKRYNPESLRKWLAANAPKSAPGAPAIHPKAEGIADTDAHLMNVRLVF